MDAPANEVFGFGFRKKTVGEGDDQGLCICRPGLSRDIDAGIRLHTHRCWLNLLNIRLEASNV